MSGETPYRVSIHWNGPLLPGAPLMPSPRTL